MKFPLIEPQRGLSLLQTFTKLSEQYPRIDQLAPIGADVFVFIYPIFLVFLYTKGMIRKQLDRKEGALFIFFSCLISILTNICIQAFFLKDRPNIELFHLEAEETLLHKFLPSSSFPSDHAAVSMSIAIATLLRGYKTKNKNLIRMGYFLIIVAIIMSTCRVITVVHRPTDIL